MKKIIITFVTILFAALITVLYCPKCTPFQQYAPVQRVVKAAETLKHDVSADVDTTLKNSTSRRKFCKNPNFIKAYAEGKFANIAVFCNHLLVDPSFKKLRTPDNFDKCLDALVENIISEQEHLTQNDETETFIKQTAKTIKDSYRSGTRLFNIDKNGNVSLG